MYQVDEKDKVIELKNVPQSSVGAPMPVILSDEHQVFLAYLLQYETNWNNPKSADFERNGEPIAIIEFKMCRSFMFGSPNEEVFQGHPLYERGLRPYSVSEIENSWIRKLERMNSVHELHKPENFEKYKHFVFAFHDSTFECVATNFEISIHESSLENILPEMQKKLFSRFN